MVRIRRKIVLGILIGLGMVIVNGMSALPNNGKGLTEVEGQRDYKKSVSPKFADVDASGLKVVKVERLTYDACKTKYKTYVFPKWSPDGRKIVFGSNAGFRAGGFDGVWIINADGKNKRELTIKGRDIAWGLCDFWSSSSKELILNTGTAIEVVEIEKEKIYTVATSKRDEYLKAGVRQPSGEIISVIDGRVVKITQDKTTTRLKSFPVETSADQGRIIYYLDEKIWIADADGKNEQVLVKKGIDPIISPDGKKVCYQRSESGHIIILWIDGTKKFAPPLLFPYYASWSPDGTKIIVNEIREEGQVRHEEGYGIETASGALIDADLYVGNANNTGWRALTDTKDEAELYPDWSPDGSKIVYVSGKTGDIYVITLSN